MKTKLFLVVFMLVGLLPIMAQKPLGALTHVTTIHDTAKVVLHNSRVVHPDTLGKKYRLGYYPNLLANVPATGNSQSLRNKLVRDTAGYTYLVDYYGNAGLVASPAAAGGGGGGGTTLPSLSGQAGKVLSNNGATLLWSIIPTEIPAQSGNTGKVLSTDGTNPTWQVISSDLPTQAGNGGKLLSTNGTTASWQAPTLELPAQTGNTGKVLSTDGTNPTWQVISSDLPTQAGNGGKLLSTNGTTASWQAPTLELPAQTGNTGKVLSTDGTNPTWQVIPSDLPTQAGNGGKLLSTNGTTASWQTPTLELPAQAGNTGRVLGTDGTNPTWQVIPSDLPTQAGNGGKLLSTNGTTASWQTPTLELPAQAGNTGRVLGTDGTNPTWINSKNGILGASNPISGTEYAASRDTLFFPTTTDIVTGIGYTPGKATVMLSLANNGTPGTYGTTTKVPQLTTDAQGRVAGVNEVDIAFPEELPGNFDDTHRYLYSPNYGVTQWGKIGHLQDTEVSSDGPIIGDLLVYDGLRWKPTKLKPDCSGFKGLIEFNDYPTVVTANGWTTGQVGTGATGSVVSADAEAGRPGIGRISSGTGVVANFFYLLYGNGNQRFVPFAGTEAGAAFKLNVASVGTDSTIIKVGFGQYNSAAQGAFGAYIEARTLGTNAYVIRCVTSTGSTVTFTNVTSVAPALTVWNKWRVVYVSTSMVEFYINDLLVATHTTTIDPGTTNVHLPYCGFGKTGIGATTRLLSVDYVYFKSPSTRL